MNDLKIAHSLHCLYFFLGGGVQVLTQKTILEVPVENFQNILCMICFDF